MNDEFKPSELYSVLKDTFKMEIYVFPHPSGIVDIQVSSDTNEQMIDSIRNFTEEYLDKYNLKPMIVLRNK